MKKILTALMMSFFGCLLTGCSSAISKDEVAGRYIFAHDGVQDILIVNANGTYAHTWTIAGKQFSQRSRWDFDGERKTDYFAKCTQVTFWNFEQPGRNGFWPACIEKSLMGTVSITVNEDLGQYYKKQ